MSSEHANSIDQAVQALKKGGIIVFPTDTAYGLGCDYRNQSAILRILRVKGRTDTHFTLIAGSLEQVQQHFTLNKKALELAKKYWPGPLSLVVNSQFAVRVPNNDSARQIATQYGHPVIATSANISKQPPEYSCESAKQVLGEQNVDVWVNGGSLEKRQPSTVVDTTGETIHIIRQGSIVLPQ